LSIKYLKIRKGVLWRKKNEKYQLNFGLW